VVVPPHAVVMSHAMTVLYLLNQFALVAYWRRSQRRRGAGGYGEAQTDGGRRKRTYGSSKEHISFSSLVSLQSELGAALMNAA
jgi:hypothetical protein